MEACTSVIDTVYFVKAFTLVTDTMCVVGEACIMIKLLDSLMPLDILKPMDKLIIGYQEEGYKDYNFKPSFYEKLTSMVLDCLAFLEI